MEEAAQPTPESGSEGLTVRLPDDVARSVELLVQLTAPAFRDAEHLVVEAVHDLLDEVRSSGARAGRRTAERRGARRPVPDRPRVPRPRGPLDPERARAMFERYNEGHTLDEVGQEYGLTRERVRQVLVAAGYQTRTKGELRDLRIAVDDERAPEVLAMFREEGDIDRVAARVGLTTGRVRDLLSRHEPDRRAFRRAREGAWARYSDQEVMDSIRAAATEVANRNGGQVLTGHAYERIRKERTLPDGRPWPSMQTAAIRFGSWRATLEKLGLRANRSSGAAGRQRFSRDDCIEAVREARRLLGRVPTASEYQALASQLDDMPSVATVRHRIGSWQRALRLAVE